jgi:hypothetical protein
MFWALFSVFACEPTNDYGGTGDAFEPVTAEEVWAVSGGAGDLAWDGERLLATAELGDSVLAWDPETDLSEEIGSRLGGSPTAIALGEDGTIYVAVTDSGVEGFVGILTGLHESTLLASSAEGLLFRRPVDMILSQDGFLIVADSGAEAVWRVPVDGSAAQVLWTDLTARSVAEHQGGLVVATEQGIFQDDGGNLVPLTELAVRDLISLNGVLLGTTSEGVVDTETGSVLVSLDAGRPAAMIAAESRLWVADESSGRIWQADTAGVGH